MLWSSQLLKWVETQWHHAAVFQNKHQQLYIQQRKYDIRIESRCRARRKNKNKKRSKRNLWVLQGFRHKVWTDPVL